MKVEKETLFNELMEVLELNENPNVVTAQEVIKYVFDVFNLTECEEFVEHVKEERGFNDSGIEDEDDSEIEEEDEYDEDDSDIEEEDEYDEFDDDDEEDVEIEVEDDL
jgi:hypothetical protein